MEGFTIKGIWYEKAAVAMFVKDFVDYLEKSPSFAQTELYSEMGVFQWDDKVMLTWNAHAKGYLSGDEEFLKGIIFKFPCRVSVVDGVGHSVGRYNGEHLKGTVEEGIFKDCFKLRVSVCFQIPPNVKDFGGVEGFIYSVHCAFDE